MQSIEADLKCHTFFIKEFDQPSTECWAGFQSNKIISSQ